MVGLKNPGSGLIPDCGGCLSIPLMWGISEHPLSISFGTATLLVSLHCMWVLEMMEGWSEWKWTCWASRGRAQGDSGSREVSGRRGYLGKV